MTDKNSKVKIARRLNGEVVSDKMDKTIVVKVERTVVHPIYRKRYVQSKKYKAHDEKNEYAIGDKVIIEATRPMSATKRWRALPKTQETK